MEVELEALELEVSDLVSGDDLEPCEVFLLGVAEVDDGREEYALAVGGREFDVDPSDVAVGDVVGGLEFDVGAGEGVGVHTERALHLFEFDAGGELVDESFGARGLEPEVGDAAVDVFSEVLESLAEPGIELRGADAVEHLRRGSKESADGLRGGVGEVFGAIEDDELLVLRQAREGLRALDHEAGDVAEPLAGEPLGEGEVAGPQAAVEVGGYARGGLEGASHLAPTGLGEDGCEGDEFLALGYGRQNALSEDEGLGGEVVGAVGEGLDERDEELHFVEADLLHEVVADVEEAGGKAGRLPGALGEAASEAGPSGDVARGEGGEDARAGAEVGRGDDGRVGGELDAALDPSLELGEADDVDDVWRGLEVLGGGLPGAGSLLGDADAFLGPPEGGRGPDDGGYGVAGAFVGREERRGMLPQLFDNRVVFVGHVRSLCPLPNPPPEGTERGGRSLVGRRG